MPVVVKEAAGHIRTVKFVSHKDMAVIDLRALPLPSSILLSHRPRPLSCWTAAGSILEWEGGAY